MFLVKGKFSLRVLRRKSGRLFFNIGINLWIFKDIKISEIDIVGFIGRKGMEDNYLYFYRLFID